ncbi:hypothetical protein BBW65_05280 [Helicobacter enhydrae]|uniref:Uncharacterized protein n=1 Tax=Helicobacter enhydrae TaxID=222136 RepID=A0A1B1U633_9HELI|nr:hypothetical protein BBW65_05280 [Helicobacter enhydrae]
MRLCFLAILESLRAFFLNLGLGSYVLLVIPESLKFSFFSSCFEQTTLYAILESPRISLKGGQGELIASVPLIPLNNPHNPSIALARLVQDYIDLESFFGSTRLVLEAVFIAFLK